MDNKITDARLDELSVFSGPGARPVWISRDDLRSLVEELKRSRARDLIPSAVLEMAPQPLPLDVWPCSREWMADYRAWWIKRLHGTGNPAPIAPDPVRANPDDEPDLTPEREAELQADFDKWIKVRADPEELLAALEVARSRMAHFTLKESIQVDAAMAIARNLDNFVKDVEFSIQELNHLWPMIGDEIGASNVCRIAENLRIALAARAESASPAQPNHASDCPHWVNEKCTCETAKEAR